MNPYDFARIDWSKPPKRHKPVWHHHLVEPGKRLFSGSLEVDIYAETPLFIANSGVIVIDPKRPAQSMQNPQGNYIIPGSSIKGILRSVVETLGNGCLTLFDGKYERDRVNYRDSVPPAFRHCTDVTEPVYCLPNLRVAQSRRYLPRQGQHRRCRLVSRQGISVRPDIYCRAGGTKTAPRGILP